LAGVIGHADRVVPLRDYCLGLLMPGERKSVEPIALAAGGALEIIEDGRTGFLVPTPTVDALAAAGVREAKDEDMVHAFEDLTDKENANFRYVY